LLKEEKQLILKFFQKETLFKRFDYVSQPAILFLLISLSTFFLPTDVNLSFLILDRIQEAFLLKIRQLAQQSNPSHLEGLENISNIKHNPQISLKQKISKTLLIISLQCSNAILL
jgi:hypothetical protein